MHSKEDEHACFHDLELICGRHFNKGVLDKEGAAEDFNHIDSDGSGFLRSVCVCACFEV